MAAKAGHWIIINARGQPIKCLTDKKAEKAKAEVSKLEGYEVRQIGKERCPFCNPKPDEAGQDRAEATPETYQEEEMPDKPGQCRMCKSMEGGQYKLLFHNHILVRECKLCGDWFNLVDLKPWEGPRK